MKQQSITLLLIVLMSMFGAKASAYDIQVRNADGVTIWYNWINNHTELAVTCEKFNWAGWSSNSYYSGNVVIPESVEYEGSTYSVTSIGESAFFLCSALTSVTIPISVTSIGKDAFRDCSGLTSVHISDIAVWFNIKFEDENSNPLSGAQLYINGEEIKNLIIPTSVASIGDYAFYNYRGLTSVTIPNSVTSIGESAFQGCSGLTSVTIPNSVTSIGESAFQGCSGLTSVTIPNSITSIGESAFSHCSGLTSVTIPNSVTSIGGYAFAECNGLTSVIIPNSVTSIGESAFQGCSVLTSVVIGSGVTSIGSYAFSIGVSTSTYLKKTIWLTNTPPSGYRNASGSVNYVSNEQYNIDNKVVYPFLSSYFDVDGIRYVPVSPSERTCDAIDCIYDKSAEKTRISATAVYKGVTMAVKNIQPYLAYNNKFIKELTIDNDGELAVCAFMNCMNIEKVVLGNKVSAIGASAFEGCSSIEEIDIPDIVTSLNPSTFSSCTSLKAIVIKPKMTEINSNVFKNCTSLTNVVISDSDKELKIGSNGNSPLFSDCPLD
jgi:hypothetical protein